MGVDTKAIIRKGVTIQKIEKTLSDKYENVKVHSTSMSDFFNITFLDGEDSRQLAVSFSNSCEREEGIGGIWLSLGMWGNSVEIMKYLCHTFGGYIDENDCDDEGFYPIMEHLHEQGVALSEKETFTNKIIMELGYDNLKKALKLFEEYKNL